MSFLVNKQKILSVAKNASFNLQFVRYNLRHKRKEPFRKPVWQPIAPSKLYRIKQKEVLSPEEKAQREHLEYTYSINMKSINEFFRNEFYLSTLKAGGRSQDDVLNEEEEQQSLIEENNCENEKIAQVREERLKEFRAENEANLLAKKIQLDEDNKRLGEEFDVIVKREIERSKTYITKENLDEKIEEVLIHQASYNFAIDTNGKVIFDRTLHPYALTPKSVPETSSNTEEYKDIDTSKPVYLKARKLF